MLKSMKMEAVENEDVVLSGPKKPEYPYGLRLKLEGEVLKKLELQEMPDIGSMVDLMAKAKVVALRKEEDHVCLEIQITDMGLGESKEAEKEEMKESVEEGEKIVEGSRYAEKFYGFAGF